MVGRALTVAIVLATIIGATPAAAATRIEPTLRNASVQSDLIVLINVYRASNGLQAVSSNGALAAAATWMANDMAARNYVGHVSSDGRSPTQRMSAFGYPVSSMYTGEDVGAGYGTAGAVLAGWQASTAHNAVLLNPNYNAIGIGLVHNPSAAYKWYWVADFGGPGGTVKAVVPPPPPLRAAPAVPAEPTNVSAPQPVSGRAAPAPRSAPAETVDPQAAARAAEIALVETTARRITRFFVALHRMGAI